MIDEICYATIFQKKKNSWNKTLLNSIFDNAINIWLYRFMYSYI